jgi:hypothetical protein
VLRRLVLRPVGQSVLLSSCGASFMVAFLALGLAACGMQVGAHEVDGSLRKSDEIEVSENAKMERVDVSFGLEQTQRGGGQAQAGQGPASKKAGFSLSGASQASRVKLSVSGCASGFSKELDSDLDGFSLSLFKGDRGCVARLVEFDLGGVTYKPVGGVPFAGSLPGVFTSGTQNIDIVEVSNLSDPVTGTDLVSFGTQVAARGDDAQLLAYSPAVLHNGTSEEAPAFEFYTWPDLSGLAARRGVFTIVLECKKDLTLNGTACPTASGQNQLMRDMAVIMRSDLNSGQYPTYAGAAEVIRRKGRVESQAVSITDAQVTAPYPGFRGGLVVTLTTQEDIVSVSDIVVVITSNRRVSETAYGHTVLSFKLAPRS